MHVATAIGVTVAITDTTEFKPKKSYWIAFAAFIIGIGMHGVLDYVPHCYPINSKVDAIVGLLVILVMIFLSKSQYKPIVASSLLGNIFPDIFDLSPQIIHKYLSVDLHVSKKIFPWHWHIYSGSIYDENSQVSTMNHCIVLLIVVCVCGFRYQDFRKIFLLN